MRSRNIKPGLFKNEDLAELPPEARLLYVGLWCMADREGRLEDRPRRIKAEIFPFGDADVEKLLDALAVARFIRRYGDSPACIDIPTFKLHQNPHKNEKPSVLPAYSDITKLREDSGTARVMHRTAPADSLLLIPDSRGERACAREEAPPDPYADVDFGEAEPEQETDPLLEFALTELPQSDSSRDDYAKVLTKHRGRLHEQTIERILSELATWKPKTPRSKLHLTLNAWLLKCPNEPMPASHVAAARRDDSGCVPMPEELRGLFKKAGVLGAFGRADAERSAPTEKQRADMKAATP